MKRFLFRLLKFSMLAIGMYVIMLVLFINLLPGAYRKNAPYAFNKGFNYIRLTDAKVVVDLDILFIGSSHAYRGYDTRIFQSYGWKSFNLGSSSQTPIQTRILLERYLDKMNPKLVVFDVYPRLYELDGVESSLDLISNDVLDRHIFELVCMHNNIKVYNTLVYSFISRILRLNDDLSLHELSSNRGGTYIPGGFVESSGEFNDSCRVYEKTRMSIAYQQKIAFEAIIEMLKQRNVKYILVNAPVTQKLYYSYSNWPEMDSFFSQKGKYLNFNKMHPYLQKTQYFYDADHLNHKGVVEFNHKLVPFIKNELKAVIRDSPPLPLK